MFHGSGWDDSKHKVAHAGELGSRNPYCSFFLEGGKEVVELLLNFVRRYLVHCVVIEVDNEPAEVSQTGRARFCTGLGGMSTW